MKRLIGSYVVSQYGELTKVDMHVPSTTYMNRGIYRLSPSDIEFLLDEQLITDNESYSMLLEDFLLYIEESGGSFSILTSAQYRQFAELKYAPKLREFFNKVSAGFREVSDIENTLSSYPKVSESDKIKWYKYLCNEFIKLYIYKDIVEFRICGDSGFDWNDIIIDDILLNDDYDFQVNSAYRFTIIHEDSKRYKPYFMSATLSQILENDSTVMSSEDIEYSTRTVEEDGSIIYT